MTDPKSAEPTRSHLEVLPDQPLTAQNRLEILDEVLSGLPSAPDMVSVQHDRPWYVLAGITPVTEAQLLEFEADIRTEVEQRAKHGGEPYIEGLDAWCSEVIGHPVHTVLERDPGDSLSYDLDSAAAHRWFRNQVSMNLPEPTYMRWLSPEQKERIQVCDTSAFPEAYIVSIELSPFLGIDPDADLGRTDSIALIVSPATGMYTGDEITVEEAHARGKVPKAVPKPGLGLPGSVPGPAYLASRR
ncbi:hypothetical protein RE9425_03320 [Prescottella equi]|nr:hypothetical protein RE9425_03320 [Prescottella equi]